MFFYVDDLTVHFAWLGADCANVSQYNLTLTGSMYFTEAHNEIKKCLEVGGAIKTRCTSSERPAAGGCFDKYCCCVSNDRE